MFAVTAVFSVVAYLWLLIILVASSRDVVDWWEAVITLLFFPLLVTIAWVAEKNFFGVPNKTDTSKQIELGSFQPGESKSFVPFSFVPVLQSTLLVCDDAWCWWWCLHPWE